MKGSSTGLPLPGSRVAGPLATARVRLAPRGPAAAAVVAVPVPTAVVTVEGPALAVVALAALVVALLAVVAAVVDWVGGVASPPQAASIIPKISNTGTKMALLCNIAFSSLLNASFAPFWWEALPHVRLRCQNFSTWPGLAACS